MDDSVNWFVVTLVLLTFSAIGCGGGNGTVPPPSSPPPAVPSASITVMPSTVVAGQPVVLAWQTANATDVSIAGIGEVALSGSESQTPTDTTTYTLTATGPGGTQHATAQVTVTQPPPPPPPNGISAHYTQTILSPVDGGTEAQATSVNDSGEVAGYSMVNGEGVATTWDADGTPTDLGPGFALAINDNNLVVGYQLGVDGKAHAILWPANSSLPPTSIGAEVEATYSAFGGSYDSSEALGIDDDGSIVGFVSSTTHTSPEMGWKLGPTSELQELPIAEALGIRSGLVGGYNNTFNAVLGAATFDNVLGTVSSVSKDGRASGYQFNGGGFIWQGDRVVTVSGNLYGINSQGIAVGFDFQGGASVGSVRRAMSAPPGRRVRLTAKDVLGNPTVAIGWTAEEGEIDLNARLQSTSDWRLMSAAGINEGGIIVGAAINDQTQVIEGFVLKPE